MTPKDYVAVGQSFELLHEPGSLFTVTDVKRTYSRSDGEVWYVTVMCLVAPKHAWHVGGTSVQTSYSGTLNTPWRRVA